MENIIWRKITNRATISVVTTNNWKDGKPINRQIPKYLVHITDKILCPEGECPLDKELHLYANSLDLDSLSCLLEAFHIKEQHNKQNLKNPEPRIIETTLKAIFDKRVSMLRGVPRIVSVSGGFYTVNEAKT